MKRRQIGFSMVEMMVAMTVTLIVIGAVYKLVTAGQGAFRREPALADRQASIRTGMDMVSRDVLLAGYSMPPYLKVFTEALNGVGPENGTDGTPMDQLEFFSASDCPPMHLCDVQGNQMTLDLPKPECFPAEGKMLFMNQTEAHMIPIKQPGGGDGNNSCKAGVAKGKNGHLVVELQGKESMCAGGGNQPFFTVCPTWVMAGLQVRYRVRSTKNVPNLERSTNGDAGPWEIVARGIEDFQVQYMVNGVWRDDPGIPADGNTNSLVSRVRISLGARVVDQQNLAGQKSVKNGPNAPRGRLESEVVPRAAKSTIEKGALEM